MVIVSKALYAHLKLALAILVDLLQPHLTSISLQFSFLTGKPHFPLLLDPGGRSWLCTGPLWSKGFGISVAVGWAP